MLIAAAAREWQCELRQGSELVRIGIETGGTDRVVGKQDPADRDDDGAAAAAATCRDKQRQRKRETKKQRKNGAQRADGSKDARSAKVADQSRRRRPFPSIRASHLYAPRHLHPAGVIFMLLTQLRLGSPFRLTAHAIRRRKRLKR